MKLLVNCSNIRGGGASQVALATFRHLRNYPGNSYCILLSPDFKGYIDPASFTGNFTFHFLDRHIGVPIHFLQTRKILAAIEKAFGPDCTFTLFGPSYWTPVSPHLMGYAIPHYVYPESPYFRTLTWKETIQFKVKRFLQRHYLKKNADFYHVETEDVKSRLVVFLDIPPRQIHVVPAALHPVYYDAAIIKKEIVLGPRTPGELRLISISGLSAHKNLQIIKKVIPILEKKYHVNARFILTIPDNLCKEHFHGMDAYITNVGPVSIESCPSLYEQADFLFLPTLLECFSALYLEAMFLGKPMLTSDLSFAHAICMDAASYFNPLDPEDIAEKIYTLKTDERLRKQIIDAGHRHIHDFPSNVERTQKYISILQNII